LDISAKCHGDKESVSILNPGVLLVSPPFAQLEDPRALTLWQRHVIPDDGPWSDI
jgi:hypothetical protein